METAAALYAPPDAGLDDNRRLVLYKAVLSGWATVVNDNEGTHTRLLPCHVTIVCQVLIRCCTPGVIPVACLPGDSGKLRS